MTKYEPQQIIKARNECGTHKQISALLLIRKHQNLTYQTKKASESPKSINLTENMKGEEKMTNSTSEQI